MTPTKRLRFLAMGLSAVLLAAACEDAAKKPTVKLDGRARDMGATPDAAPPPADMAVATPDAAAPDMAVAPDALAADLPGEARPMVPMTPLPPPWKFMDVGTVGIPGAAGVAGGVWVVQGAGADIEGTADAFNFAHRPLSGDAEIIVRVVSLENTDPFAKVGLMFRESLAPDSKNVAMLVNPPGGRLGLRLQYRDHRVDAITHFIDKVPNAHMVPVWLRLVREGNKFTGYSSPDGFDWDLEGEITVSMPKDILAGIAVTSHMVMRDNIAVFDRLSVTDITQPMNPDDAWEHQDLATLGGYVTGGPTNFRIESAGPGISNTQDGVTYLSKVKEEETDTEITVKIASLTGSATARAGIMFRWPHTDVRARMVFFSALGMGTAPVQFQIRTNEVSNPSVVNPPAPPAPDGGVADADPTVDATPPPRPDAAVVTNTFPIWLKVVRVGRRYVTFYSHDGRAWTQWVDNVSNLPDNTAVGIAVASGNASETASATIEDFRIVSPPVTPIRGLDAGAPAGDAGTPADAPAATPDAPVATPDAAATD